MIPWSKYSWNHKVSYRYILEAVRLFERLGIKKFIKQIFVVLCTNSRTIYLIIYDFKISRLFKNRGTQRDGGTEKCKLILTKQM